jgi:hypothetical protein
MLALAAPTGEKWADLACLPAEFEPTSRHNSLDQGLEKRWRSRPCHVNVNVFHHGNNASAAAIVPAQLGPQCVL